MTEQEGREIEAVSLYLSDAKRRVTKALEGRNLTTPFVIEALARVALELDATGRKLKQRTYWRVEDGE